MISYRLGVDDLASMRFACSPLLETATSLWALVDPSAHVLHLPWIRRTAARLADWPELPLVRALVAPEVQWLPDFLTPRPDSPLPDPDDELHRIRLTPPERVAADVVAAYAGRNLPPVLTELLDRPRLLRDRISSAVTEYWRLAIELDWPRMLTLLEADLTYRAQLLARGGAAAVLTGLDPSAQWSGDGVLRLRVSSFQLDYDTAVAGRGFWLIPTLFAKHAISPVGPDEPPTIAYPARAVATLWETAPAPVPRALADLVGQARAALLMALDSPSSTLDLARRRGVTPSAVSQQLATLRANGLVSRARTGKVVLYARTELGDRLCQSRRL